MGKLRLYRNWTYGGSLEVHEKGEKVPDYCIPEDEDDFPKLAWLVAAVLVAALVVILITVVFAPRADAPASDTAAETVDMEGQVKADEGTVIELPAEPVPDTEDPAYKVAGISQTFHIIVPPGLSFELENYLNWRTTMPECWVVLVRYGHGEEPPLPIDPAMALASELAACAQDIDNYLSCRRGSPLQGYGLDFARAGYKYGINPYLLVALAGKESSFATDGSYYRTNHNAWGMLGSCPGIERRGGACWWPDWPIAIDGAAMFIAHYWPGAQDAGDLHGYCEGNPHSWTATVSAILGQLGGAPW
jgi:hypothetical protein